MTLAACGEATQAPRASGEASPGVTARALDTGPDFVVTSVTGPASTLPWQPISLSLRVCNQGTRPGGAWVELYASQDDLITPGGPSGPSPDMFLGNVPMLLDPGECRTESMQVNASMSEGAYYLGAVADPMNWLEETDETNNVLAGSRLGVGNGPDLVVSSVTVPTSTQGNQPITLGVSVCNQGTQSGGGNVELYLSRDAVIVPRSPPSPTSDVFVGSLMVQMLAPGLCWTEQVQAMGGTPGEGSWYAGAVVDPDDFTPELIEDNNTLVGNRMGVGNKPELVVTAVTGATSALPGSPITVTATVCNQGNQLSAAPVEWYLSEDAVITPRGPSADFLLGSDSILPLFPGQCATRTLTASTGNRQGTYHVGAAVDADNLTPEFFEDNNTHPGYRIAFAEGPDFVVASVSGAASAWPYDSFSAAVRVCNQGTARGQADVELYVSRDAVISPSPAPGPDSDRSVSTAHVDLAAGECRTETMTGFSSGPEGRYYLGAAVDARNYVRELFEDNNTLAGHRFGVGNRPDFIVTSVSGPASVMSGQPLTVTATVCNQGTREESADVQVLLSQDEVITPSMPPSAGTDLPLGLARTSLLAPGMCQTLSIPAQALVPWDDGAYHLGAAVDPMAMVSELFDDNNTRAGPRLGVGNLPNLVVTSISGPVNVPSTTWFDLSATVCNEGTQATSGSEVAFYMSQDTSLLASRHGGPDVFLDIALVDPLAPGQCQTVTVSAYTGYQEGAWYPAAMVDPDGMTQEFIEDDNTRLGNRFGVGEQPDFVVTSITAPSSVQPGSFFDASVVVCNQGTWTGSTRVSLYLSEDTVITPGSPYGPTPDFLAGSQSDSTLAPGQCETLTVSAYAGGSLHGSLHVGAFADPDDTSPELLEDNNAWAGGLIDLGP